MTILVRKCVDLFNQTQVFEHPVFRFAIACLLALGIVMPTHASEGRAASWVVASVSEQRTIDIDSRKRHTVYTRLLPVRHVSPASDIVSKEGALLVGKGAQLVWVAKMSGLKNDRDLYCTFRNPKNSGEPYWRYNTVSNKLICFFDVQADAVFDGYMLCYAAYPSFLVEGKCHKDVYTLGSAAYTEESREDFRSDLTVGLSIVPKRYLFQCVGSEKSCDPLVGGSELRKVKPGARLAWLGSDIEVSQTSAEITQIKLIPISEPRVLTLHGEWVLFDIWL